MKTKIAIACDDLGFETKEAIKKYLIEEKNADVVYDPVQVPEDGVNTFAKLADEMSVLIQKRCLSFRNIHLWNWNWFYLSSQ